MSSVSFNLEKASEIAPGIFKTTIEGLFYIKNTIYTDNRGFFTEIVRIPELEEVLGHKFTPKQTNLSLSKTNVVRGMHAEDWNKLVTVLTGRCFIAIADIRPDSTTFAKVETFDIEANGEGPSCSLFLSRGLANSLAVIKGPANYYYLTDALYKERDTKNDVAISLFDPTLKIDWPIPKEQMIYSERDENSILLSEKYPEKF